MCEGFGHVGIADALFTRKKAEKKAKRRKGGTRKGEQEKRKTRKGREKPMERRRNGEKQEKEKERSRGRRGDMRVTQMFSAELSSSSTREGKLFSSFLVQVWLSSLPSPESPSSQ